MRDLWEKIHRRFVRDKLAMISVVIIAAYVLAGILALLGILAPDYAKPIGEAYAPP